jgi:hypothetical protein
MAQGRSGSRSRKSSQQKPRSAAAPASQPPRHSQAAGEEPRRPRSQSSGAEARLSQRAGSGGSTPRGSQPVHPAGRPGRAIGGSPGAAAAPPEPSASPFACPRAPHRRSETADFAAAHAAGHEPALRRPRTGSAQPAAARACPDSPPVDRLRLNDGAQAGGAARPRPEDDGGTPPASEEGGGGPPAVAPPPVDEPPPAEEDCKALRDMQDLRAVLAALPSRPAAASRRKRGPAAAAAEPADAAAGPLQLRARSARVQSPAEGRDAAGRLRHPRSRAAPPPPPPLRGRAHGDCGDGEEDPRFPHVDDMESQVLLSGRLDSRAASGERCSPGGGS